MKILFHHLAKTAGTSLIESFIHHLRERACAARYDFELTEELMTSPQFDFYHGHFSFDKVAEFRKLNPDCFVFTFVRNPFNRVVSQYHNWTDRKRTVDEFRNIAARGAVDKDFVEKRVEEFDADVYDKSLVEFLSSKAAKAVDVYENHQVRYLSFKGVYMADHGQALAQACDHLEHFYNYVGLTEWYDASIGELNDLLRLPPGTLSTDIVKNTNAEKKVGGGYRIPPEAWAIIAERNMYDLGLFMYAVGRFRTRHPDAEAVLQAVSFPVVQG